MSNKISRWIRLIGIAATIPIFGTILVPFTECLPVPNGRLSPTQRGYANAVAETSLAQSLLGRIEIGNKTGSIATLITESNHQGRQVTIIAQNTTPNAVKYLVSALQKYKKQDYQGALADYDRAISIDPKLAKAYNNRGFVKAGQLQDYRGGLADMNRAISIDPKLADAYMNRGELKSKALHDLRG